MGHFGKINPTINNHTFSSSILNIVCTETRYIVLHVSCLLSVAIVDTVKRLIV